MGIILCATRGGEASRRTQQEAIKIAKEQKAAINSLEAQRKKGLAQLAKAEAKEREYQAALNLTVKSENILKLNILIPVTFLLIIQFLIIGLK